MGYLTNRRILEHLEDLEDHLPAGWTYNTPCMVQYHELEDFREVSHSNLVFMKMLNFGWSINQVLNGPGWKPLERDVIGEQKEAAESWAVALDDAVNNRHHHPHESGAYIHTMWARAANRTETAHAIYAVDLSDTDTQQFKDNFCNWVQDLVRDITQVGYVPRTRTNIKDSLGLASKIYIKSNKLDYVGLGRRTTRVPNAGRKRRGSTLADKRSGLMNRRSNAVWV